MRFTTTRPVVIIARSKMYPDLIKKDIIAVDCPLTPYIKDDKIFNRMREIAYHIAFMRAKKAYREQWGMSHSIMDVRPWRCEIQVIEKVNLNKIQ